MKKIGLFYLFLIYFQTNTHSQNFLGEPIAEIEVEGLDLVSLDNSDQIYISSLRGDLFLYNNKGKQINYFSPPRQGKLSQLEASWTVNIFTFSEDLQEYRVMDRFLNPIAEQNFMDASINLAKAATFGNNNIIWVWDESDLSLKRMDYLRNLTLDAQPLNLIVKSKNLDIQEMKEYQNRLFVLSSGEGVYMFDNQGNLIRRINLPQLSYLSLYKGYLVWLENGYLFTYCLSTKAILKLFPFQNSENERVLIGNTKLLLISTDRVKIFEIPSPLKNLR